MFHSIIKREELIGNFLQINFPINLPNVIQVASQQKVFTIYRRYDPTDLDLKYIY
jgi:hypothetical protein